MAQVSLRRGDARPVELEVNRGCYLKPRGLARICLQSAVQIVGVDSVDQNSLWHRCFAVRQQSSSMTTELSRHSLVFFGAAFHDSSSCSQNFHSQLVSERQWSVVVPFRL